MTLLHLAQETTVSALGTTGQGIKILSVLQIETPLLQYTYPGGFSGIDPEALEDWGTELNNQLIGRLKNKLLQDRCLVTLGLSSVIRGKDMVPTMSSDAQMTKHLYTCVEGSLCVILSVRVAPPFILTPIDTTHTAPHVMAEGAISFF